MHTHFSHSLRRMDADRGRRSVILLAVVALALAVWSLWFITARVALYATAEHARIEVARENHPVDAPVGGRVVLAPFSLSVGRKVSAGDLLLELDANPERLAQHEAQARLAPVSEQIQALARELAAEQRALDEELRSAEAARAESLARIEQATLAADLATEESARLSNLERNGLVSGLEALRSRKISEERRSEVQSAEFASSRIMRDFDARKQDRMARMARLQNEIAGMRASKEEALASADRLGYAAGQRQIRAPISGTLAEASSLKVGSMIQPGDRICTIVPDGDLKVVALFAPSDAMGRIHNGQSARIRLEGFPWTQYGSAAARVSRVASEVREGQVRVELDLVAPAGLGLPMQHGLPADVDVEIDQISPMAMVLRGISGRLRVMAASPDSPAP